MGTDFKSVSIRYQFFLYFHPLHNGITSPTSFGVIIQPPHPSPLPQGRGSRNDKPYQPGSEQLPQSSLQSPLQLRVGLVTQFMEGLDLDLRNTLACVCGPEIMMRFVVRNLLLQGYREDRIYVSMERRMRCGTGHCGHCQIGSKFVCQDGPIFLYPDIKRFADTVL